MLCSRFYSAALASCAYKTYWWWILTPIVFNRSPSSSTESFNDKEEPEDNAAKTKCNTDLKKSDGIEPSASNSKPSIETNYIPANREGEKPIHFLLIYSNLYEVLSYTDGTAVIKNKGPVAQANAVDQIYNVTSPTTSLRESNSECKEIAIQQSNEDELVDVVNTPSTTPNSSPSKVFYIYITKFAASQIYYK